MSALVQAVCYVYKAMRLPVREPSLRHPVFTVSYGAACFNSLRNVSLILDRAPLCDSWTQYTFAREPCK